MYAPGTAIRSVVVCGAGVAGLETVVALRALAGSGLRVELVSPTESFELRAFGVLARLGAERLPSLPLDAIAADLGVTLHRDAVHRVRAGDGDGVQLQSGAELPGDAVVLAVGAFSHPAYDHGACAGRDDMDAVIADLRRRPGGRLAVVVPPAAGWTLPAYEIAMAFTAAAPGSRVVLVTHEAAPLEAFGPPAGELALAELAAAGVEAVCGIAGDVPAHDAVDLGAAGLLEVDHVVHLPVLAGPRLRGVSSDHDGFMIVDGQFRAGGRRHVYAAGDAIAATIKQGGLAAQHGHAVATRIAAGAGADVRVEPFEPVLRGLLRTPRGPRYLRSSQDECLVSEEPLWWPPTKVASRWLAPWLAARAVERGATRATG